MPAESSISDDIVASLLAKDAKTSNAKYSAYGLQKLLPKRPTYTAPKPNTRFLKNIIKETDSHNAALRAKEAAESRARLRRLRDSQAPPEDSYGRLSREHSPPPKRRRVEEGDETRDETKRRSDRNRRTHRSRSPDSRSHRRRRRHRDDSYEHEEERQDRSRHHRRHHHRKSHRRRSRSRSTDDFNEKRDYRKRSRSRSRLRPRSRSRSPRSRRRRHRSRDRRKSRSMSSEAENKHSRTKSTLNGNSAAMEHTNGSADGTKRPRSLSGSDSDPLEAIIGPPAPPPPPKIKARGRGTFASTSAMDSHFSSTYDPSIDVQPDPDLDDDWDMALEALRDRQKWQKQGAERLKAAGFTEEEVEKWEKGGEKREEDVRWKGRGEGREWDRGKVVGDDGVETVAEWGRLKGT